jgi:hypothetical protein
MISLRTRVLATAALLTAVTGPALAQRGPAPAGKLGVAPDVLAAVCAPRPAFDMPDQSLRVTGGQDGFVRRSFAPGDLVTINGGTQNGIEVGQEYFVRRMQIEASQRPSRTNPASVRTAGWIKVYAVDEEMSLATIVHACDTIDINDYLEPFVMPEVPKASTTTAKPQRDNYGEVLFGVDYRRAFGKNDFFIINRGSDHGVEPGDRFVVYRNKHQAENFLFELGEAVAIEVTPETSTLQATVARDYFAAGDLVAIRK